MELSLSAMARKMIGDRILSEVRKLIREKASTVFLASVLPPAPRTEDGPSLRVEADLKLTILSAKIASTLRTGDSSEDKELLIENEEQEFSISTGFRLRRPEDLSDSVVLKLELEKLELAGTLSGIEFTKMMLGAGATVHGIELRALLSGSGTGTWQLPEPEEKDPQRSDLS